MSERRDSLYIEQLKLALNIEGSTSLDVLKIIDSFPDNASSDNKLATELYVADYVDQHGGGTSYTAGDGIGIEDSSISVKISSGDNNLLTVDENGLLVDASSVVSTIKEEVENSLIGTSDDPVTALTIHGAKNYSDSLINDRFIDHLIDQDHGCFKLKVGDNDYLVFGYEINGTEKTIESIYISTDEGTDNPHEINIPTDNPSTNEPTDNPDTNNP